MKYLIPTTLESFTSLSNFLLVQLTCGFVIKRHWISIIWLGSWSKSFMVPSSWLMIILEYVGPDYAWTMILMRAIAFNYILNLPLAAIICFSIFFCNGSKQRFSWAHPECLNSVAIVINSDPWSRILILYDFLANECLKLNISYHTSFTIKNPNLIHISTIKDPKHVSQSCILPPHQPIHHNYTHASDCPTPLIHQTPPNPHNNQTCSWPPWQNYCV